MWLNLTHRAILLPHSTHHWHRPHCIKLCSSVPRCVSKRTIQPPSLPASTPFANVTLRITFPPMLLLALRVSEPIDSIHALCSHPDHLACSLGSTIPSSRSPHRRTRHCARRIPQPRRERTPEEGQEGSQKAFPGVSASVYRSSAPWLMSCSSQIRRSCCQARKDLGSLQ